MCAAHLTVVVRNTALALHKKGRPRDINIYELDLSGEHMTHVYRFLDRGKFDREEWKRMRGFIAWKVSNYSGQSASSIAEQTKGAQNGY